MNAVLADILGPLKIPALVFSAGFGALWGSFLNVCIARIPRGISVVRPPSHCLACGTRIKAYDNVPILSYLILRGRCRHCGARFGARHALVEALTAALSTLVFAVFALDPAPVPLGVRVARYVVYFAFAAVLVVLTFIDLDTKRLPDIITLPAVVVFFAGGFATGGASWGARLLGAASGYLAVRIIADGYYYATGREGLGLGDGKLLALMGALLGWQALPPIVFCASCAGVVVSVPVLFMRTRRPSAPRAAEAASVPTQSLRRSEVPFAPFLAASALGYLFFHDRVRELIERIILGG